jgi:hypothetical protein
MRFDQDTIRQIKESMGYVEANVCCKYCVKFRPLDISGSPNAQPAHCTLNPAIDIPVSEGARCNHFYKNPTT